MSFSLSVVFHVTSAVLRASLIFGSILAKAPLQSVSHQLAPFSMLADFLHLQILRSASQGLPEQPVLIFLAILFAALPVAFQG